MTDKASQVERAADRIRTEFISTLQELDRRRAAALDVRAQLLAHKPLLLSIAGGAAALAAALIGYGVLRQRYQKARLRRERVRGFIRAWEHPRRVATAAPYRPLPVELLRKAALAFAVTLASSYARRAASALVARQEQPQPLPEPQR